MPDEGIQTKVGIQGDRDYKQALADIGRQLTVLNTSMKASQSAFGDQATTMAGMQDKLDKLGSIYDAQREKVELIAAQLEKAKKEFGDNSKQADQLRIALNRATSQMNGTKTQITATESGLKTLAQAQETVGDETDATNMTLREAEKALKEAADAGEEMADKAEKAGDAVKDEADEAQDGEKKNSRLKTALAEVGRTAGGVMLTGLKASAAALAAVSAAAGAALVKSFDMAKGAGTFADDLLTLSTTTGISAKSLQEWSYAGNFIDTSVDTISGSMTKLTNSMKTAQAGSKESQAAFIKLGVSWRDYNGNLRDNEDVFWDLIDALGKVENETERDALAMQLFGKSAKELNPLIEAGSRAFKDMGREAEAMGTVFSQENLDKMGAFDDSMQRFNATGEALKDSIGLVMIPAFQPLVDAASTSMGKVAKALQDGVSPKEMPGLVQELMDTFSGALDDVIKLLKDNEPLITETVSSLVSTVAEKLPGLLSTLLPAALGLLQSVLDGITENIEPLTKLATSLVSSLAGFLGDNLPTLAASAVTLVGGLVDALIDAAPQLITAGVETVAQLAVGLINAIPDLVAKLPEITKAIWDGIAGIDWPGLGGQVLSAITGAIGSIGETVLGLLGVPEGAEGTVTSAWQNLAGGVGSAITGALSAVTGFLGKLFDPPADSEQTTQKQEWGSFAETLKGTVETAFRGTAELVSGAVTAGVSAIEAINWENLGTTIGSIGNGLIGLTGNALAAGFQAGHALIQGIDWAGLGTALAAVPNGLISVSAELLSKPFETAAEVIGKINWSGIGDSIANGLDRAWGIVAGIGDVALGVGEAAVGAGKKGVDALKQWIAGWGSDGGVESEAEKTGKQIVTDVGTGVTNGTPDLVTTAKEAAKKLLTAFAEVLTDDLCTAIGTDLLECVRTGIEAEQSTTKAAAETAAKAIDKAIKDVLSRTEGVLIGNQLAQGVQDGIRSYSGQVANEARSMAANTAAQLRAAVVSANFPGIGRSIDDGVAQGIRSGSGTVAQAAREAARAAYNAMRQELQINSPSKAFAWLGEMSAEGYASGWEESAEEIRRSIGALTSVAAADTAANAGGWRAAGGGSGAGIDYDALADAMTASLKREKIGQPVMTLDGRMVAETTEPMSSRATQRRAQRSVKGRSSRLVTA